MPIYFWFIHCILILFMPICLAFLRRNSSIVYILRNFFSLVFTSSLMCICLLVYVRLSIDLVAASILICVWLVKCIPIFVAFAVFIVFSCFIFVLGFMFIIRAYSIFILGLMFITRAYSIFIHIMLFCIAFIKCIYNLTMDYIKYVLAEYYGIYPETNKFLYYSILIICWIFGLFTIFRLFALSYYLWDEFYVYMNAPIGNDNNSYNPGSSGSGSGGNNPNNNPQPQSDIPATSNEEEEPRGRKRTNTSNQSSRDTRRIRTSVSPNSYNSIMNRIMGYQPNSQSAGGSQFNYTSRPDYRLYVPQYNSLPLPSSSATFNITNTSINTPNLSSNYHPESFNQSPNRISQYLSRGSSPFAQVRPLIGSTVASLSDSTGVPGGSAVVPISSAEVPISSAEVPINKSEVPLGPQIYLESQLQISNGRATIEPIASASTDSSIDSITKSSIKTYTLDYIQSKIPQNAPAIQGPIAYLYSSQGDYLYLPSIHGLNYDWQIGFLKRSVLSECEIEEVWTSPIRRQSALNLKNVYHLPSNRLGMPGAWIPNIFNDRDHVWCTSNMPVLKSDDNCYVWVKEWNW